MNRRIINICNSLISCVLTVPSPPLNLRVVASSATSAIASWAPPATPRGVIAHYRVRWARSTVPGHRRPDASSQRNTNMLEVSKTHARLPNLPKTTVEVLCETSSHCYLYVIKCLQYFLHIFSLNFNTMMEGNNNVLNEWTSS